MSDALTQIFSYHQATKHRFDRFATGPDRMDWATQPNPFRRYDGAPLIALDYVPPGSEPRYDEAVLAGQIPPQPLSHRNVSQLFSDSLAISAWKRAGGSSWALRINPSSGNLHPTEGYLVCGPIEGLGAGPMVCHYAPAEHALERRARFPLELWRDLTEGLPEQVILVALTSVHWREAWKYGERAYRYCQHDVGHAVAAVSLAAAALGWQATLLDDLGVEAMSTLLGVCDPQGAEAEEADCVLAICPQGISIRPRTLPNKAVEAFSNLSWLGKPNTLSRGHVEWPMIGSVRAAAGKPPTSQDYGPTQPALAEFVSDPAAVSLRKMIHQRRSAVDMDGRTGISGGALYKILSRTLALPGQFPFNALSWKPLIHLALFVHRVQDLDPGLYMLVRDPGQTLPLRAEMKPEFMWERPIACPEGLGFYRLLAGDTRLLSREISCNQAIASDGCFSLGMIAEFERPLRQYGAWFYPRLFWECGMVGQVLYLEAESAGIRGTGIGCFFDDPMHSLMGLKTVHYQSLYHFTVGGPRLQGD